MEFTRCILTEFSGVEMNVSVSDVDCHVSATTVNILTDVLTSFDDKVIHLYLCSLFAIMIWM